MALVSPVAPQIRLGVVLLPAWLFALAGASFGQGMPGSGFGNMGGGPGGGAPIKEEVRAPTVVLPGARGAQQLVADVRIVGNETVERHRVESHIRTRKDRQFDPELVQSDVRRLISSGLFRDVRTFTEQVQGGVVVIFEVLERPTIRYIKFVGNFHAREGSLEKEAGLAVGDALDLYAVEEARRKLEEFYHTKGYSKTEVSVLEGNQPGDRGVVFMIGEGRHQRIEKVQFVGNTIVSGSRLKTQIESKPGILYLIGGKVDRSQIEEDVDRLTAYYRSLGYFRARVGRELEFDDSGRWLTLTFVIDEGPRYEVRSISMAGNHRFTDEQLRGQLKLKPGQHFNLDEMKADVNTLRDLYGGFGHIFVDVDADPRFLEEPGKLDLVYNIQEGDVWRAGEIRVHIAGDNPHTKQKVVLDRFSFGPGDVIDLREVRNTERRLKASQLFENDPAKGSVPKIVIRPPENLEEMARGGAERSIRGQNPEAARPAPARRPFRERAAQERPASRIDASRWSAFPAENERRR